ncbi:MAG: hypothetical protein IKQ60_03940 [Candidatus Methanomethylophilaceae archaeon]|nr:hypothetical protein [Candidatus Methanomethylophilaceae archaeon]
MDSHAAVNGLKKVAEGHSKYFELMVVEGDLEIRGRNNAMSLASNR